MLNEVILIDDDEVDNETHARVLKKSGVVKNVRVFQYAEQALEYLRENDDAKADLILLDINMPRMNGFEFLTAYASLGAMKSDRPVVIMLTTSSHPGDRALAENTPGLTDFLQKPLTPPVFASIVTENFGLKGKAPAA
ncbi:MAG: response regulator [Pseudomonadota bacterium]